MKLVMPVAALALAGCATTRPSESPTLAYARMIETVRVDGPRVTPLAVIEDSRCPKGVQCVWAGRLRLSVRIDLGKSKETRELTLGQPQHVADGSLELVEATPYPVAETRTDAKFYRFGFRFMGGI